jgi:nitrogen fixation NifU-like protein
VSDLGQLYRESIRRHAGQPTGFKREIVATHRHEEYNPLCGDRVEIALRLEGEQILETAFDGEACTICMASASMLCEALNGSDTQRLRDLNAALRSALAAGSEEDPPGELAALGGVRTYPSRVRCATLPWVAAVKALA